MAMNPPQGPAADLPLVSLVLPAYNEAAILAKNLQVLHDYLQSLADRYRFEILIVNDGSADATGEIAEAFAREHDSVRVLHHPNNYGLGQAFQYAFSKCRGDFVVTMDVDLSYSPQHIERLLERIVASRAKLVLASPYMRGGSIENVPWLRRVMSIWANRFLSFFSHGNLSTLTCMVRAYDGNFIRALTLRSTGMDVMPETVYKSMIMRGRIEQIPADLDWGPQVKVVGRRSSMRVLSHIIGTLLSGFILRPFMFFVVPGIALLGFALYVTSWMFVHFFEALNHLPADLDAGRWSAAVALAYQQHPHTFIVGLLSLMLAVQLVSLGIMALQSKYYFEEIFYLGSVRGRQDAALRAASAASEEKA